MGLSSASAFKLSQGVQGSQPAREWCVRWWGASWRVHRLGGPFMGSLGLSSTTHTNTHAHTQICRKLRALFGVEQVPIVMCTAMGAGSSALNRCKGAGATDVLLKPFERAKMLDQVQRHCSHKVGGGGGRQAWALGTHTRLPQV